MHHTHATNDGILITCATSIVLVAAAAFALLIYPLITAAVPLLETALSQPLP
jgi:hypothetical protein